MSEAFHLKNGTVLLSTEAPGGLYNAEQLKKIASLCDDDMAIVRATEDQRIALFVKEEKAQAIKEELTQIGLGIRDYQAGLHQPVACLGELCPEHEMDAMGSAMDIAKELQEITLKTPLKIGINGCNRCCVPCHTYDISVVGDSSGYRLSLGGKNSQIPEMARFMAEGIPYEKLPELLKKVIEIYQLHANVEDEETLQDVIDRTGVKDFVDALSPYSQDAADDDDPFGGQEEAEGGDDLDIEGEGEEAPLEDLEASASEPESDSVAELSEDTLDEDLSLDEDPQGEEELSLDDEDSLEDLSEDDTQELDEGDLDDSDLDAPQDIESIAADSLAEDDLDDLEDLEDLDEKSDSLEASSEEVSGEGTSEDDLDLVDDVSPADEDQDQDLKEEVPIADDDQFDVQDDDLDEINIEDEGELELEDDTDDFSESEEVSSEEDEDAFEEQVNEGIQDDLSLRATMDKDENALDRDQAFGQLSEEEPEEADFSDSPEEEFVDEKLDQNYEEAVQEDDQKAPLSSDLSVTGVNLDASGLLTLNFDNGAILRLKGSNIRQEKTFHFAQTEIILRKVSDGFEVEVDGIALFIPKASAAA